MNQALLNPALENGAAEIEVTSCSSWITLAWLEGIERFRNWASARRDSLRQVKTLSRVHGICGALLCDMGEERSER